MAQETSYLKNQFVNAVTAIVEGIDRDVERGEDLLMFGFCVVMLSSSFAPIVPPKVLLPLVAIIFAISGGLARKNYHNMQLKLANSMHQLNGYEQMMLAPIISVFSENPMPSLVESYNPLKDLKRTLKSVLGGLLINPLWTPIFYMMGIHMKEERNLFILNRAIIGVEKSIAPPPTFM